MLHQECESAHRRLAQALGAVEHDQVEGIRGFRRAVKKIRCALQLTAGGLGAPERQLLDQRCAALARRLGTFRDLDAREKKLKEIIARLPAIDRDGARLAWLEACGATHATTHGENRREVLEGLTCDTEQFICMLEKIRFPELAPHMVAGSIEHLWKRARSQADKSWVDRDDAWLHSLRKRIQRTHIAFRLTRDHSGEHGLELEKRFDAAAKAMGELRDASMIRLPIPTKAPSMSLAHNSTPPEIRLLIPTKPPSIMPAPNSTPLEKLQMQIALTEGEAMKQARKLVAKAFKSDIAKTLRHIALHMHSL